MQPMGCLRESLLDETSCLVVEESVFCARAQWPTGSTETADVVIGSGCRGFGSANIFGSIAIDRLVH